MYMYMYIHTLKLNFHVIYFFFEWVALRSSCAGGNSRQGANLRDSPATPLSFPPPARMGDEGGGRGLEAPGGEEKKRNKKKIQGK